MRIDTTLAPTRLHLTLGTDMFGEIADGYEQALFGMGCFWGVERMFWDLPGVLTTSVGYAGGQTDGPNYKDVCTGRTGHAEVVHVVFDPTRITFSELLKVFFENHDPTTLNRQGNDRGSQYRSAIFAFSDAQLVTAQKAAAIYSPQYKERGMGPIVTEITRAPEVYYAAEDYHQQYLKKNPGGYCNHGPTGVSCPIGVLQGA